MVRPTTSPEQDLIGLAVEIRALRLDRDWRQADLAAAAGVSQATVSRMECGSASTIPIGAWQRVAQAFGTTFAVSFDGAPAQPDVRPGMIKVVAAMAAQGGWTIDCETVQGPTGRIRDIGMVIRDPGRGRIVAVRVWDVPPSVPAMLADLDDAIARVASDVEPADRRGLVVVRRGSHASRCLGAGGALLDRRFRDTGSRWPGVLRRRPAGPLPPDGLLWMDAEISRLIPTRLLLAPRWDRGGRRAR